MITELKAVFIGYETYVHFWICQIIDHVVVVSSKTRE